MIHKTLTSYHNNDPFIEDQEHPDGPLWLIALERDWDMLPQGIYLEHMPSGKQVIYDDNIDKNNGIYGVRGYRE